MESRLVAYGIIHNPPPTSKDPINLSYEPYKIVPIYPYGTKKEKYHFNIIYSLPVDLSEKEPYKKCRERVKHIEALLSISYRHGVNTAKSYMLDAVQKLS